MDVTIEHELGRSILVSELCDKRQYLATYNAAAERYVEFRKALERGDQTAVSQHSQPAFF
jgi:hypothetical protein